MRFKPETPLEFAELCVLIEKDGEFYRCIQYSDISRNAIVDIRCALQIKYPTSQGYKISIDL